MCVCVCVCVFSGLRCWIDKHGCLCIQFTGLCEPAFVSFPPPSTARWNFTEKSFYRTGKRVMMKSKRGGCERAVMWRRGSVQFSSATLSFFFSLFNIVVDVNQKAGLIGAAGLGRRRVCYQMRAALAWSRSSRLCRGSA